MVVEAPAGSRLHVAPLDFTFSTGTQFPAEYRGSAFIALHGSWNRSQRIGYKVAFVPFKDGRPSGPPRDLLTGWMLAPNNRDVWGRPVAVLTLNDGSLLVSDDGGKKIWRVQPPPSRTPSIAVGKHSGQMPWVNSASEWSVR